MKQKGVIIVNSMVCKRGPFGCKKSLLLEELDEHFGDMPVFFTEHPAHATFIAQENANVDTIIVAGGDGTISEVLNGMDLDRQVLGVIPMGTGNSLARQSGIRSFKEALQEIDAGKIMPVDILECYMTINDDKYKRLGIATTGFGYGANVADIGNIWFKGAGRLCYVWGSIFAFLYSDTVNARVTIDGEFCIFKKVTNVFINNTNFSGNFRIFTEAALNDGKTDVLYSFNNKFQQLIQNIGIVLKRRWLIKTKIRQATNLEIVFEKPTKFMVDGEMFDYVREVSIKVQPKRLKLII